MKRQRILFVILALPAIFASSLAVSARTVPQEQQGRRGERRAEKDTVLGKHMEAVEDGVKALRRSIRDEAKVSESLATLAVVQAEALAAKQEIPLMAANVPEDERDAFVRDYRKEMVVFITRLLELETTLLDGDADAIKEAYRAVHDMEDRGHERFTEDG